MTLSVHSLLCCYSTHVNRSIYFLELKEAAMMMYGLHVVTYGEGMVVCFSVKMAIE